MIEWIVFSIIGVFIIFIGWAYWDQERQLEKTFDMFGSTGFWDVDARIRETRGPR